MKEYGHVVISMVNKCAAPNCENNCKELKKNKKGKGTIKSRSNSKSHRFPTESSLQNKWKHAVPRKGWSPSKNSVLCEKHFLRSDFKEERIDSNLSRKQTKGKGLKRQEFKPDAIPSQWPDCRKLLSKSSPRKRKTCRTSSSTRLQNQLLQEKIKADKAREKGSFSSPEELHSKLDHKCLPSNIIVSYSRIFLSVSHEKKPDIDFCLKISESLHFEMWCKGKIVNKKYVSDPEIACLSSSNLTSCNLLLKILFYLRKKFTSVAEIKSEKDMLNEIVEQVQEDERLSDNKKVAFLVEQLSLVYSKPNGRRYSSSLLAMSFLWQSVCPALYNQISLDGMLNLPSSKYIRNLVARVGDDLKLTDPAKKYLEARFSKLNTNDHQVSLLMDEVYCKQTVQYSNGRFFGAENNEITKTLLCVMVKSVCGKYRDVVSMTPISNINADNLYTVWENCITVLSEIGFVVVITMTDGHKSNEKLFKKILRGKEFLFIEHPYFPGHKIFIAYDPTHLFKNFYNNFMMYDVFLYPNFQDIVEFGTTEKILQANFGHIRQLHVLEFGKPVKMGYKLNDKVLNPCSLEKTSVKLADSLFHESTINESLQQTWISRIPGNCKLSSNNT